MMHTRRKIAAADLRVALQFARAGKTFESIVSSHLHTAIIMICLGTISHRPLADEQSSLAQKRYFVEENLTEDRNVERADAR